jgi:divalent metal cation (Fe/Co/Zn/Cd) transporter
MKESNHTRGDQSWVQFVRRAKAPELPVVLLEDVAALTGLALAFIGVVLAVITGNGLFDGIGTVAIGVLLVLVALVLGIETKSLLVGEGASEVDTRSILGAIEADDNVERVIHMKTLYLGPEELLVAAKVALPASARLEDVANTINAVEARIRAAVPIARVIYIEPDVYVPPAAPAQPTEAIVIKASD